MIPGHMVAETLCFLLFLFFSCVFAVFWKRHVWFVWVFGLGSFVSYSEKQLKIKNPNKPNMQFSKHAKTQRKNKKKQKKTKSQQPCAQESCYKKLVVELWFLCVWGALLFFGLSLPLSFSTCLLTKRTERERERERKRERGRERERQREIERANVTNRRALLSLTLLVTPLTNFVTNSLTKSSTNFVTGSLTNSFIKSLSNSFFLHE